MAMVLHPDVFRKLQAEMDSIVGKTRLPTIFGSACLGLFGMCIEGDGEVRLGGLILDGGHNVF